MPQMQGKFVWYDLMTTDMKAAEAFYHTVVGWDAADSGLTDRSYSILSMGRTMVAGLMPVPEEAAAKGMGPMWLGYLGVSNVDEFAVKVKDAGGSIMRPPEDIPTVGRFAVAGDPQGAAFLLFQPIGDQQMPPFDSNELGRIGWNELHAGEWQAAWTFYAGLFGWEKETAVDMGPMGTYQTFGTGATGGGMMTKMPEIEWPFWLYYFNVDSVSAAVDRITEAGGKVVRGPHEVPGGAWIAQAVDPQGAFFAVTSRNP